MTAYRQDPTFERREAGRGAGKAEVFHGDSAFLCDLPEFDKHVSYSRSAGQLKPCPVVSPSHLPTFRPCRWPGCAIGRHRHHHYFCKTVNFVATPPALRGYVLPQSRPPPPH